MSFKIIYSEVPTILINLLGCSIKLDLGLLKTRKLFRIKIISDKHMPLVLSMLRSKPDQMIYLLKNQKLDAYRLYINNSKQLWTFYCNLNTNMSCKPFLCFHLTEKKNLKFAVTKLLKTKRSQWLKLYRLNLHYFHFSFIYFKKIFG